MLSVTSSRSDPGRNASRGLRFPPGDRSLPAGGSSSPYTSGGASENLTSRRPGRGGRGVAGGSASPSSPRRGAGPRPLGRRGARGVTQLAQCSSPGSARRPSPAIAVDALESVAKEASRRAFSRWSRRCWRGPGAGRSGQGGSWEAPAPPPASSRLLCQPASGPMVCPAGCRRGSACAGQLLLVTPVSWPAAPKGRRRALPLASGMGGRRPRRLSQLGAGGSSGAGLLAPGQ